MIDQEKVDTKEEKQLFTFKNDVLSGSFHGSMTLHIHIYTATNFIINLDMKEKGI